MVKDPYEPDPEAVAEGAKCLDEWREDWALLIDLSRLRMGDPKWDILGQLGFSLDYPYKIKTKLKLRSLYQLVKKGFIAPPVNKRKLFFEDRREVYNLRLGDFWTHEINKRWPRDLD